MSNRIEAPCVVEKVWGHEDWLVNEPLYCLKRLFVTPGFRCSMHKHPVKAETFVIEHGAGWAFVGDEPIPLTPGVIVKIPPDTWHCFWCPTGAPRPLVMLEVSTHHDDADVERHSESGPLVEPLRCAVPGAARGA